MIASWPRIDSNSPSGPLRVAVLGAGTLSGDTFVAVPAPVIARIAARSSGEAKRAMLIPFWLAKRMAATRRST